MAVTEGSPSPKGHCSRGVSGRRNSGQEPMELGAGGLSPVLSCEVWVTQASLVPLPDLR